MAVSYYATGKNDEYDLGLGDDSARSDFNEIGAGDWLVIRHNPYDTQKFSIGIKSDGTMWGWGDNTYRQLGGLPNASYTTPTQIGSATDWADVALGDWFMLARKTNGTIYACGRNTLGQCATGNTTSPVTALTQIGSATDWSKIFAGADNGYAIKTGGTLYGWGLNDAGQVGKGSTGGTQTSPIQEATASTLWASVAAGIDYVIALRSNGTLWGFGNHFYGANGLGATVNTPTQIGSGTTWQVIASGRLTSHAIKSDGTLWSWGYAGYYSLGTGNTTQQYYPVQIGSATDWDSVEAGSKHLIALNTASELWGCGNNADGQLGDGTTTSPVTTLTQITGLPITPDTINAASLASFIAGVPPVAATNVTAPITLTVVAKSGKAAAPVKVNVRSSGTASAAVRISVVDTLDTVSWSAVVTLGGVDVSARLTGAISVDAEEGSSRIASFSLIPASGSVNPLTWSGSTVTIDMTRIIGGVAVPSRLFTGLVDLADYDPAMRLVSFNCTDDLQRTLAAATVAQIDALTGGYYSASVQGIIDDRWAYAQARMETRPASLDAGPHANLRVTDWDGLATWRTFTAADIHDEQIGIELPRRRDLINQVEIAYEYRYSRLRERHASIAWSGTIVGAAALASGYQFPALSEVESAVSGLGWHIISSTYNDAYAYVSTPYPAGAPSGADSDWWIDNGGGGISNYSAHLAQRHAQTVTEASTLTVSAPSSIAINGIMPSTLRGALASTWDGGSDWEADMAVTPDASAGDIDYAPDATRADSDAAIECLLAMARTRILASHRTARARFSIPCLPELDLIHAVEIDTATLDCAGKVARVQHVLDIDAGSATTLVTVALSGVAAGGIVTETTLAAPTPPDIDAETGSDNWAGSIPHLQTHVGAATISAGYSDSMMGFICNAPENYKFWNFTLDAGYSAANGYYSAADVYPVTGFRASMPGVASSHRNPVSLATSAAYDVAIPEDPLTLTA